MYKEKNSKVFNEILDMAIGGAQRNFPPVYNVQSGMEVVSLSLPEIFEDSMARFELLRLNKDIDPNRKNLVFASSYAAYSLNTMYARDEIINNIDDFFLGDDNLKWLKNNGLSEKDFEPLKAELKKVTDDALRADPDTKEIADFIAKIDAANPTKEQREDFYKSSVNMLRYLNQGIENSRESGWKFNAKTAVYNAHADAARFEKDKTLCDLMRDYVIRVDNVFTNESKLDVVNYKNLGISYGEGKSVHPTTFLEHFNENPASLTKEELEWAHSVYSDMASFVNNSSTDGKERDYKAEICDFYANGQRIISYDEARNAKNGKGENDPQKYGALEAIVVAKVLSGEKVTAKARAIDDYETVLINPEIAKPKETKLSISTFFKWLWEKLFSNVKKEIGKVDKMNEKFEKNTGESKAARMKTDFKSLVKSDTVERINTQREKSPEKTASLNGPQK